MTISTMYSEPNLIEYISYVVLYLEPPLPVPIVMGNEQLRVAILGPLGTYSHDACSFFFHPTISENFYRQLTMFLVLMRYMRISRR
jgi:hypothetical protein